MAGAGDRPMSHGPGGWPRRWAAGPAWRRWPPSPARSACTTPATIRPPRPGGCSASCRRCSGGADEVDATSGLGRRLAAVWRPDDVATFGPAIDRALVLLADHELATSTLAVRVAGSTWAGPYPAFTAGLATVQGALHGGAAREAHDLLVECEQVGAAAAVARRVRAGERLPGYGHKIYKGDDPRLAPLLEVVAVLPDPHGRRDVVADLRAETGVRFTRRPNVDLGLGRAVVRRRPARRHAPVRHRPHRRLRRPPHRGAPGTPAALPGPGPDAWLTVGRSSGSARTTRTRRLTRRRRGRCAVRLSSRWPGRRRRPGRGRRRRR